MPTPTSAQSSLGTHPFASDDLGLIVEVDGSYIFVLTARGNFRVTYKMLSDCRELVLKSEWCSDRQESPTRLTKFRARAWGSPTMPRMSSAGLHRHSSPLAARLIAA